MSPKRANLFIVRTTIKNESYESIINYYCEVLNVSPETQVMCWKLFRINKDFSAQNPVQDRSCHERGNECHDDEHGEKSRRNHLEIKTDIEDDKFYESSCVHEDPKPE